jgi:flagellar basal body-associated protein FliL
MEPTQPAQYSYGYYSSTDYQPNPYERTPIPPPPPRKSLRSLIIAILLLVIALLLFAASGLFIYLAHTQAANKGQATPVTSTPTTQQNYTANDILQNMQKAGCSCGVELTSSMSVDGFIGQYAINEAQATSQEAWSDPMQQFDNVGLWVFVDAATALNTFGH